MLEREGHLSRSRPPFGLFCYVAHSYIHIPIHASTHVKPYSPLAIIYAPNLPISSLPRRVSLSTLVRSLSCFCSHSVLSNPSLLYIGDDVHGALPNYGPKVKGRGDVQRKGMYFRIGWRSYTVDYSHKVIDLPPYSRHPLGRSRCTQSFFNIRQNFGRTFILSLSTKTFLNL